MSERDDLHEAIEKVKNTRAPLPNYIITPHGVVTPEPRKLVGVELLFDRIKSKEVDG